MGEKQPNIPLPKPAPTAGGQVTGGVCEVTGRAGRIPKPVRMKGAPGPVRAQVPRSVPEDLAGEWAAL